jgi:nucleotide-binding universal stress UspA family protein
LPGALRKQLRRFYDETVGSATVGGVVFEIATGKPAVEILRLACERAVSAIVIGTHGLTGVRQRFLGSTTERILRESTVPVLTVPARSTVFTQPEDRKRSIRRVLVPVDLTAATPDLVIAGSRVAVAAGVPLLLAHVVEPVRFVVPGLPHLPNIDLERRARAESSLAELVATIPATLRPEGLVAYGDPAEELAKIAHDRDAGLIVVGLHASAIPGTRMGSVTYRVMCLTPTMVLALPPGTATAWSAALAEIKREASAGTGVRQSRLDPTTAPASPHLSEPQGDQRTVPASNGRNLRRIQPSSGKIRADPPKARPRFIV